ncbi:MAG: hypothetical protein GY930_08675 [bacterium]|nr:hypothetical protein [bacterium]
MILRSLIFCLIASAGFSQQPGVTVMQPSQSTTAYAIDLAGNVVHSWPGTVVPGFATYMAPNGDLVRSLALANPPGAGGGFGGGIERVSWDGQVLWSFQYTSSTVHSHHDIALMPNGNVLMIAWESIGSTGAIALGRNPSLVNTAFWADHVIEIEPDGNGGAAIVWEWHLLDHLVQQFDASKPNFDLPSNKPERVDINFPASNVGNSGDWTHCNGIDYNAELDQIVLSSRSLNEIWIIDHSTTTLEASGSTGGLRGRGGDLLYRWGNARAYGRGTAADQTLFGQHDCQWIAEGRPGAGNLLVFNNGTGRPTGSFSSADEIAAPLNGAGTYDLAAGQAFGPAAALWSGTHPNPLSFFSVTTSGCERQPNGNTLMVKGNSGLFIEIDMAGTMVWSWQNNLSTGNSQRLFKGRRHAGGRTGVSYCGPANPSSHGLSTSILAMGSDVVSENALTLLAEDLPLGEFGFFLNGTGNGVTPLAGGSSGDLCLSTSLGRYSRASEIFFSGDLGAASLQLDLDDTPTPLGRTSVLAGQTLYFQAWFRDTPASTSNFSNAVAVVFQ